MIFFSKQANGYDFSLNIQANGNDFSLSLITGKLGAVPVPVPDTEWLKTWSSRVNYRYMYNVYQLVIFISERMQNFSIVNWRLSNQEQAITSNLEF